MKTVSVIVLIVVSAFILTQAGDLDPFFKSIQDRSEYISPFATILGTMTNTGWYESSSIGRSFGFSFGLPISLTYISSKDRSYTDTYIDSGCVTCNELAQYYNVSCDNCVECQKYTAPTILGTDPAPVLSKSILDVNGNIIGETPVDFSDGIEAFSNFSALPFAMLQMKFSYFHTGLRLRYLGMPTISGISLQLPGVGIQHDLASVLPELPVTISLATHFSWILAGWEPGENIDGRLSLNGSSSFAGVLVGYKFKRVEFFLESGWEKSQLGTSGTLTINQGSSDEEIIEPDFEFDGRNMFRASLNIAFAFGYRPVIGQSVGANFSTLLNLLSFQLGEKE